MGAAPVARAAAKKARAVEARVGLELAANGGFAGTVAEVGPDGVKLTLTTGGTLAVRYGETVTVRGQAAVLTQAPEIPAEAVPAEEALRAWRRERCKADGVSAFIVASNAVLRAIAVARPSTSAALAAIDGIGPTKLDLYGDEILAVLDGLD
jgi:ATP-dependent DNA helicase RecQ